MQPGRTNCFHAAQGALRVLCSSCRYEVAVIPGTGNHCTLFPWRAVGRCLPNGCMLFACCTNACACIVPDQMLIRSDAVLSCPCLRSSTISSYSICSCQTHFVLFELSDDTWCVQQANGNKSVVTRVSLCQKCTSRLPCARLPLRTFDRAVKWRSVDTAAVMYKP